MITYRSWYRVYYPKVVVNYGDVRKCQHTYHGWFLLGIIPLYVKRETQWTFK